MMGMKGLPVMATGIIDWFDPEKGEGYILRDELGKRPVFIPSYVVKKAGIIASKLKPGTSVTFTAVTIRASQFTVADNLALSVPDETGIATASASTPDYEI